MGGSAIVLVFVTLPHFTCCQALSVFVGSKHHIVTKVKAAVPAFLIIRKKKWVIFSHIMLLLYPRKKPKTRTPLQTEQLKPSNKTKTSATVIDL